MEGVGTPPLGGDGACTRIEGTPFRVQVVAGAALVDPAGAGQPLLEHIQACHVRCFPEEVPEEGYESMADFVGRVTWMTEPDACTWYLLWYADPGGEEEERRGGRVLCDRDRRALQLVGIATTVPYTKSLYGFNLGVDPRFRRRGLGRRLMHAAQLEALEHGQSTISATVDNSKPRLLSYYKALGAHVVSSLSVGSSAPPSVRIEHVFTREEAYAALAEADALIARRCRRHRWGAWRVAAVALAAVLVNQRRTSRTRLGASSRP